jgi:hypothetical protein
MSIFYYFMKLKIVLHSAILVCIFIRSNAQDLNWNTVTYTAGSLNTNFGSIGNPGVSVSLNITGYTAGLAPGSPAKRIATPQAGTGTVCTQFCALRSAPTFSNPATQSLILTFTFSPAVSPLSFSLYDIDGTGGVIDSARVTASGPTGAQTVTMANVNPATSIITGSGTTTAIVKGGTGNNTDAQTDVSILGFVSTLVVTFMGQGSFSTGNMFWANALPVKWVSFSGNKSNTGFVNLKWITESEDQCDHYLIERSKDGLQFQVIGTIASKGANRNNYYFTDNDPDQGNSYYRIAEVDIDGRIAYSKVILIKQNMEAEHNFTVSPNPSSDYIFLNSLENVQLKKIEIYNALGKNMYQSIQGNYRININFLSPGIYYLKVESINGKIFSAKFFKK